MDAVFASNDQMALGVLHAAHTLGRRVPDDLSVVGVDDIAEGSHYWPPLTTVHQPLGDAGVMAVQGVDDAIRWLALRRSPPDALEPRTIRLHPRIIVRESSPVGHLKACRPGTSTRAMRSGARRRSRPSSPVGRFSAAMSGSCQPCTRGMFGRCEAA